MKDVKAKDVEVWQNYTWSLPEIGHVDSTLLESVEVEIKMGKSKNFTVFNKESLSFTIAGNRLTPNFQDSLYPIQITLTDLNG